MAGGILDTEKKSFNGTFDYAGSCGIANCPNTKLPASQSTPTDKSFYILYGSLILLCVLSILITIFFMDNISDDDENNVEKENEQEEGDQNKKIDVGKRFVEELKSLIKLYSKIDVWLIFPLTFYTGFEVTFVWFEYSRVSILLNVFQMISYELLIFNRLLLRVYWVLIMLDGLI